MRHLVARTSRLIVLAVGAATLVVPPTLVGAASITVTTTTDVVDGSDGVTSLREAFTAANASAGADTIILAAAATYDLTACASGALTHTDTAALTLDGGDATIHQTCDAMPVLAQTQHDAPFTINDLHLVGGPNAGAANIDGAGVAGTSPLVLDGVTITGVNAGAGGSVIAFDFGAAAHDAELHGVTVSGNTGTAVSNASNSSGLLVDASSLTGNTGGGVLVGDGSPIDISATAITGNGGYGVYTTGQGFGLQPVVTVADSEISGNGRGGLTCRNGCRSLTIIGSQLVGNGTAAAAGDGGGIEMFTFQPAAVTPTVTITDTTISGNVAHHDGGGLWVHGVDTGDAPDAVLTTLTGSTVADDHADCSGCRGGGIAVLVGSLVLDHTDVTGGTAAGHGGGVFHTRADNGASSTEAVFSLTAGVIGSNAAGGDGGGVWTTAHTQTLTDAWFHDNVAGGIGGGLASGAVMPLNGASIVTIDRSTFNANAADDGGGLILRAGSVMALTNSTVTGNTAARGGGIATSVLSGLDLVHGTLAANTAPVGANLAADGPTRPDRSIIAQPLGGGANCSPYVTAQLPISSVGRSWSDDDSCVLVATDTVEPGVDPLLGALADNGGATPTRLPAADSPVGGLVPLAACTITSDQRGIARPAGAACEPGAVEIAEASGAIVGSPRSETLIGTGGNDEIRGLSGADLLIGLAGDDLLIGGPGRDILRGGPGNDVLRGGPGVDVLIGGPGFDVLDGGPGRDLCFSPVRRSPYDC